VDGPGQELELRGTVELEGAARYGEFVEAAEEFDEVRCFGEELLAGME
jgi:hypothetical protein